MESMEGLKKKKVVVTGGAGFIGSHVVKQLLSLGCIVSVVDIEVNPKSFFVKEKLGNNVALKILDIRNREKIISYITSISPDYILHLAAEPIVTQAYNDPLSTFDTNIMGTAYILEACRKIKNFKGIIVASSDKAYGKTKETYTEESPLHGDHPYDVSKSAADLIAQTYYHTYGLPVVITRFGNVYGEGDVHFDRIIPGICKSIITGTPLEIRSDGTYVRDYLYVKDVARGYLVLLENIEHIAANAYNFSSKDSLSVLEVIDVIEKTLKIKIPYTILNVAKNEIPYQHLNDTKVRKFGWKNEKTLVQIIPSVVDWYRKIL